MSGKKYWDKKYAFSKKYFDQRRVKKKEQTGFRRNKNEQHRTEINKWLPRPLSKINWLRKAGSSEVKHSV